MSNLVISPHPPEDPTLPQHVTYEAPIAPKKSLVLSKNTSLIHSRKLTESVGQFVPLKSPETKQLKSALVIDNSKVYQAVSQMSKPNSVNPKEPHGHLNRRGSAQNYRVSENFLDIERLNGNDILKTQSSRAKHKNTKSRDLVNPESYRHVP
jgi:hypothetical protein